MKKMCVCLVTFLASCATIKQMGDPDRALAPVRFLDGPVPEEDVVVCRMKPSASEWACMRWKTFEDEILTQVNKQDAGSI